MIYYTYYLKHKPTGYKYYGSKASYGPGPDMFWKPGGYFGSSEIVAYFLKRDGVDSFEARVTRIFESPAEAKAHESRVIKRLNVNFKNDWLNCTGRGYKKFGRNYCDIMLPKLKCPGCGRDLIFPLKEYCQRSCRTKHYKK